MYLDEEGYLVFPGINIKSFLCSINTMSAVKMFYPTKDYKKVAQMMWGAVIVEEEFVPFLREGKKIKFEGWGRNGITKVTTDCPRLNNGARSKIPAIRVKLSLPWELRFSLIIIPNEMFKGEDIKRLFDKGGIGVGFGVFRGEYGKFKVKKWE
jgi:hypothetical protein